MRALVTGDWQASWSNLEQCEAVTDLVIKLCKKHQAEWLWHLGDLKHTYSPVDVRIVNFGVHFVKRITNAGIKLAILLGNHDRAGMSADSDNWFPALQAAGALTIDKPSAFADGSVVGVPYISDPEESRAAFKWAAKQKAQYLLFHNELRGCRVNVYSKMPDAPLSLKDLRTDAYKYCLGGHIHLYQQMGSNLYFVGSPFIQDWGEANQRKGVMLVGEGKPKFIETEFPGLYDPSLPNFKESKPRTWKGSTVRIHVAFDKGASVSYQRFIDRATKAVEKKYPGADITVVPEFLATETDAVVEDDGTDTTIVSSYVKRTCPPSIKSKSGIVQYLLAAISKYGNLRRSDGTIEFTKATGVNVLSYKQAVLRFKPGITVITGRNQDWRGRSNGSGKTSLLHLPAVALFGTTLKEQAADRWVRRSAGPKELAVAKLEFKLSNGKRCEVIRQRRPTKLKLLIDGKDHSIGIGHRGTQAAIESLTGMSWETLKNAIYIDQREVSTILTGNDTDRKAIFSRFLNLERFTRARKDCSEKYSAIRTKWRETEDDILAVRRQILEVKAVIADVQTIDYAAAKAKYKACKQQLIKAERRHSLLQQGIFVALETLEAAETRADKFLHDTNVTIGRCTQVVTQSREALDAIEAACNKGTCPVCLQEVSGVHAKKATHKIRIILEKATKALTEARASRDKMLTVRAESAAAAKQASSRIDLLRDKVQDAMQRVSKAKSILQAASEQQALRRKYKTRLRALRRQVIQLRAYATALSEDMVTEEYCVKSLSKDGIPAYMTARICPMLNAAAKEYSTLFSEGEIQVQFQITDDDIDVSIINMHGGERLEDQSQGETRIAGMITGFAIRDVINPCNVLILDEPSESLDATNAKVFAEGLRKAAKRLGAILLTTHNPYLLGELQGVRSIEVTKRNGISSMNVITR